MKKLTIISLILLALILTGCNLPGSEEPSDESGDSMATEIAKILTGTPVEIEPVESTEEAVESTDATTVVEERNRQRKTRLNQKLRQPPPPQRQLRL